ncbi:MAG: hypothetical protein K5784_06660 [Clostridiales bacterium]|nr:hypothetical protein [Clostridiales bacterium]
MNGILSAELILGIRLRDLLKLILLVAYAGAVLFGVKKHSKKRIRLLRILCAACAGMGIIRLFTQLIFPENGFRMGLDYPCAALAGFWAGAYLGSCRQNDRFRNFLGRRTYVHLIMMTLYILLCDLHGKTGDSVIGYTDEMGLGRYLPALSAAITLILLIIAIKASQSALKERFALKPECCAVMFLGALLPFYAVTDNFQVKLLGVGLDLLFGWLCMMCVLLLWIRTKLKESELPFRLKAAAAVLSLVPGALMLSAVANGSYWAALALGTAFQAAVMSPLFPYFRRPVRIVGRVKRKYS